MNNKSKNQWETLNEAMARTDAPVRGSVWALLVPALILAVLVAIFWVSCVHESSEEKAERLAIQAERASMQCGDRGSAHTAAIDFVKARLKAPSTAKFPGIWSDDLSITERERCKYTVAGHVDSQNSFGAQIRTKFVAEVRYARDTDTWKLDNLLVE